MGKYFWQRILGSERSGLGAFAAQAELNIPSSGIYHFEYQTPSERSRIHLRIDGELTEDSGHGMLLVNANRVIHLNPTATLMAYSFLSHLADEEVINTIRSLYHVSESNAIGDYAHFRENFSELIRPDGACPVCDLDIDIRAPFSTTPSAPYRMDLAVTYRCNNDCAHCYNARPRDFSEINTSEWKRIIDRLWDIGIPHLVFTGGEPSLRNDLPELIAHAESKGQITGLNTNARRISDQRYLDQLVSAGLDHVQITVESHDAVIHDAMVNSTGAWKQTILGLRNALETPLYVMTNTTMLRQNSPYLDKTLDFLAEVGVPTIGLNALIYSGHGLSVGTGLAERELPPLLNLARQKTDLYRQRLIWYTPTQYCHFDPMQLELGVKGCTAALYNMCIEPDGAVIPCQSYYHPVGNVLSDPWENIWENELSRNLRQRHYIADKCTDCALLAECGGGCPLALEAESHGLISLDEIPAPKSTVQLI
jgi:radical SAM protein with 4Fe4S-binding SPASM domain